MDDILASIRRIISDEPAPAKAAPAAGPESEAARGGPADGATDVFAADPFKAADPEPAPAESPPSSASSGAQSPPESATQSSIEVAPIETPKESDTVSKSESASDSTDTLVGESSSLATASAFDSLKSAAGEAARARSGVALPDPGRTLEDLTGDLLRPMLKAWLDEHLPAIVQDAVSEEVARIARGRAR